MANKWIHSFRLRTLPLSLVTIGMGSILALRTEEFEYVIFCLTLSTALFLQILSNLSNDYGDFIHGADNINRQGPQRMVQSGKVSPGAMKAAIVIFILLSLVSGLLLLWKAGLDQQAFLLMLIAGLTAILAAIGYTLGRKPYGYRGMGDLFVFIFFGGVGVLGTYFLQTKQLSWQIILPASSCGLLITGVLNVNNIRDIDSDKDAGKKTIPVVIGRRNAKLYHTGLIIISWILYMIYGVITFDSYYQWLFVLSIPLFIYNVRELYQRTGSRIDPLLRQLVLAIFVFIVLVGLGEILARN